MNYLSLMPDLRLSIRAALAAALAVSVSELLQLQYPLYALVGAVIVSDLSPSQTRRLGLWRLAGSVLGAAVGATASQFLPPAWWAIGLSILVAMCLTHLLRLRDAAKVSGYVCGIIVLGHGDHPWSYSLDRLIETIVGISVAILVSLIPKLIPIDDSKQQDS